MEFSNSLGVGENEIPRKQKEITKQFNEKSSLDQVKQVVPIVGIGASAGGLEAFKVLLECLPVDTGLSFVVIQHLASGQESMLTDIRSRFTKIPVQVVKDGLI